MDQLIQDVRYAVRTLARTPLLTGLAIICLSLGIGANATMFSVVQSTLIQPLPFHEPDRLVDVWSVRPSSTGRSTTSYADFLEWRRQSRALAGLAAVQPRSLTLSGGEEPERVQGAAISAGLFSMLGIVPALGRDLLPEDDQPGAGRVVILSDQLWRRRYGSDPRIIGRAIDVNTRPYTVVGVLPPGVNFPFLQVAYVALGPLGNPSARNDRNLELFGRLAPGVSVDRAREDLNAVAARLGAVFPEDAGWRVRVRPLRDYFAPDEVKLSTLTALGAVTFVLLIACANVASLLLARATVRGREMSLRAALGATRGRLVRQLLTEAVVLGLVGVPLGIALTSVGIDLVSAAVPADDVPYLIRFTLDRPTLLYTIAIAVASSFVFGFAPAWQLARANLMGVLREGGRTGGAGARARGRSLLVVVEVALSLVLLVGAALFVRSFLNLQRASVGFDPGPLMSLRVYLPGERYEEPGARNRRIADILARVERLPGVRAAGASNLIPLDGGGEHRDVEVDGVMVRPGREPSALFAGVTPGYFEALGLPMLRGRMLTAAEVEQASQVAVVTVSFVRRAFPGLTGAPPVERQDSLLGAADLGNADVVGRRVRLLGDRPTPWLTIVGVVPDFLTNEFGEGAEVAAVFAAYRHQEMPSTGLVVRVAGDPADITAALRTAIRESDPSLPVYAVSPLDEVRRKGYWQYELFSWMFSIFGGLALALGSAGVYGVLSYAVSQRTHEIGVRVALGASAGTVVRLTVLEGLRLVAIGIVAGLAGAALVARIIGSLLYDVTPGDPVSFLTVAALLGVVGFLASYLPARRAARVDPAQALRAE